jgi:membrane protein implicated in regulation of membrane protease activity
MPENGRPPDDFGRTGADARAAEPTDETPTARRRRELKLYLLAGTAALEFMAVSGAILYAFVNGRAGPDGRFVPAFPLLAFAAAALLIPALLLLCAHLADAGLFRPPAESAGQDAENSDERYERLPGRAAKLIRILRGIPAVGLLVGIILLAAAMLTLDSVLTALGRAASIFAPHAGMLLICLSVLAGLVAAGILLLRYHTRKMLAEYEYRREVLEKTGMIIVEKGARALPPGDMEIIPRVLPAVIDADEQPPALPEADGEKLPAP